MTQAAPHLQIVKDTTVGQPPPFDIDAERAVLAAVMIDPTAMPKVSDFLRHDHFYSEAHRRIFEAAWRLFAKREPIDLQTVASVLNATGRLAQVGGSGYLIEVANASPVVFNVRSYALAVHDCWRRRKVIDACQRAIATGYTSVADSQKFCDDIARSIALIGLQNPAAPVETITDALNRLLSDVTGVEDHTQAKGIVTRGVPTGLYSLDRLIGGLRRKAKTTIAAESGMGKTSIAVQIALRVALTGVAVMFFSTEMTIDEITKRAVCILSGVSNERIKQKTLSRLDVSKIFEASNAIKDLPLRVDTTASLTIEQLRSRAEAFAEESMLLFRKPLGLVVGDYVQRYTPSGHMRDREEREQIKHATKEGKVMAQALDVAYLELAQANKPIPKGRKMQRGIYGSTFIWKESDEVIFLERHPDQDPEADSQEFCLHVDKQRDGKTGTIRAIFHGPLFRFEDPNTPADDPSRQYVDRNHMLDGL